jgi:hypothetical protein
MIRRLKYTFLLVVFLAITSFGQSFSMSELIRMSTMDVDNFDTYVTSKGYVFHKSIDEPTRTGVGYAFNLDYDNSTASNFIKLYQRYYKYRYCISYQTIDKKEYINVKNQLKVLGFKLKDTSVFKSDDGMVSNNFVYRKGKAEIDIYSSFDSYEINYTVDY